MLKNIFIIIFVFGVCAGRISAAQAQNIPSPAEPGRLQKNFEEPKMLKLPPEPVIPRGIPKITPPTGAEKVMFTLKKISFEGGTVYDSRSFLPYYNDHLQTKVSLAFLYEIANAVTARYRNDGYILSRAIVPRQRIKEGRATIRIVEGYVSNVILEGGSRSAREQIGVYGQKIIGSRPLRINDLERYLLLMRDIPGHYVESLLRSSDKDVGAADLILDIRYKPFNAAISTDNRGTTFLGPVQNTVRVQGNSLLGMGDQTTVRYIGTGVGVPWNQQEIRNLDIRHRQIIGNEGTTIGVTGIRALSFPGSTLKQLEAKTQNEIVSFDVRHPFIRSRQMNLFGGIQFDYQNAETKLLGLVTADDRIRSLRANGRFDFVDRWQGITQIFAEVSHGLNIFNNSSSNSTVISRAGGRSDYTKINLEISRLQKVYGPVNLFAAVSGQYSPHRLLAAEEFGVGGGSFGRGYDPSEITGDRGIAAKAELQYSGEINSPSLDSYQLYSFYDFGAVWQSETAAGGGDSLASAGVGTRLNFTNWLTGTVEVAKPLTRSVSTASLGEGTDPRVFFSLTARY